MLALADTNEGGAVKTDQVAAAIAMSPTTRKKAAAAKSQHVGNELSGHM